MKIYNIKLCFECGAEATENHHVIPKSMGGTKTVPLCTFCHTKIHGLEKTKRADLSPELTKRGLDRNRAWDLFLIYQVLHMYNAETIIEIVNVILKEFNLHYTEEKVERLKKRIEEMDLNYLNTFFDEHIGADLSHVWNDEKAEIYLNITTDTIQNFIQKEDFNITEVTSDSIKELQLNITKKFKKAVKNKSNKEP